MINRILIRIKVVQLLYSYMTSGRTLSAKEACKELEKSLDMGYDLYHYLLLLMVELTELHADRLEQAKEKYLPTEEDLNPNTKLIDNLFVKALMEDADFRLFIEEKEHSKSKEPFTWRNDDIFMKLMLDRVLRSEEYAQYIDTEGNDYEEDCVFWHSVMKNVILPDEELSDVLEAKSVFWNDDLYTVGSFVLKTIKKFEAREENPIMPQYRNEDDRAFGPELFMQAIDEREYCNSLINRYVNTEHWDVDRIALMDRLIMTVAISEVIHYPSIPTRVTLNEYIEIAKYYSTPRSGQYINGILNSAVNYLRSSGRINKE
ncbi:MAG: transcription antitermination protein NusB [Bacteroidales bacterium]|nr:transcription antitermination protein NusB [Bacteroidales bacterium]